MDTIEKRNTDETILAALALALVDQPRASLQELANAIGVSKATLYRYSRTWEELIEQLTEHTSKVLAKAVKTAELETAPVDQAFRNLINNHLQHRELTAFLAYYWYEAKNASTIDNGWEATLDAFFLRGQHLGVFRIDLSAATLTDLWVSCLIGLVEGERRGRIARAGLANQMESIFLDGTRRHNVSP